MTAESTKAKSSGSGSVAEGAGPPCFLSEYTTHWHQPTIVDVLLKYTTLHSVTKMKNCVQTFEEVFLYVNVYLQLSFMQIWSYITCIYIMIYEIYLKFGIRGWEA